MTEVSIIIVTYNPGETILTCLSHLPKQINGLPVETIVVDNASQDGTVKRLEEQFPDVRLLVNEDNPGYGVGNNRGFSLSHGQFIVILNPDVLVYEGSIETMIEHMTENSDIGIIGPRTFTAENKPTITARHEYTVMRIAAKYLGLNRFWPYLAYGQVGLESLQAQEPMNVDWLHGSTLVVRREVYERIGGFDDGFFLFMEDVDICMRAKEENWRVVFLPTAEVQHIGSESVSRFPIARIRSYHISPLYYFRKRGKHNAVRILKAVFILELSSKSIIRRIQNVFRFDERRREKARVEWKVCDEVWKY